MHSDHHISTRTQARPIRLLDRAGTHPESPREATDMPGTNSTSMLGRKTAVKNIRPPLPLKKRLTCLACGKDSITYDILYCGDGHDFQCLDCSATYSYASVGAIAEWLSFLRVVDPLRPSTR